MLLRSIFSSGPRRYNFVAARATFCTVPNKPVEKPRKTRPNFKEFAKESNRRGYFDSLLEHRKDLKDYTLEEYEKMEEVNKAEAYHHTEKAKKWMTQDEKDKIHYEIDLKMQELEDTGLTRMEILYNVEKGIPLADDPVFQYLKINRLAREMLIKSGEVFTADAVIDKALRQDLEPDPTMSKQYEYKNTIQGNYDPLKRYKQRYKDHFPTVNEETYIYGYKTMDEVMEDPPMGEVENKPVTDWQMKRKYDKLRWQTARPPTFLNRPLTKEEARQKFMRKVKESDFNWKDTALLTQFLTKAGKIKNRYQTRLSDSAQTTLKRVVKHARNMGMIPYVGLVRPTDKLSLRSYYEDLEEFNKKSIDPLTGKMYYNTGSSDLSKRFVKPKGMNTVTETYKDKNLRLDQMPSVLNEEQMAWLEAQGYVLQQKKKQNRIQVASSKDKNESGTPQDEYLGGEIAYEKIRENLKEQMTLDDLPEFFINEKAHLNVQKPQK